MKKLWVELLIIVLLSTGAALLLPNYFKERTEIIIVPSEFLTSFLTNFIVVAALYFSYKPKEKLVRVPDGFQKLYNENGQLTKEGIFKRGKLFNGSKHVYNKDGSLSHTEKYKNGIYTSDVSEDKNLSADT